MNNKQVIKKFLEGKEGKTQKRQVLSKSGIFYYEGRTLATDGKELINYQTVIGYKKGNKLYINNNKYSVTTSKIQHLLRCYAIDYYKKENIIYYEG